MSGTEDETTKPQLKGAGDAWYCVGYNGLNFKME
jgi:hypothetical protein